MQYYKKLILLPFLIIFLSRTPLKVKSQNINLDSLLHFEYSTKQFEIKKVIGLINYQGDYGKSAIAYPTLIKLKEKTKIDVKKITTSILVSSLHDTIKYYIPVYKIDLKLLNKYYNKNCILYVEGFLIIYKTSNKISREFIVTKIRIEN